MRQVKQKSVLIFPPLASPTYSPLGITSLAAFIRREMPSLELSVFDLNLELWYSALEEHDARDEIRAFLKNTDNAFYNEQLYYLNYRRIWQELKGQLDDIHSFCKVYLETDELVHSLKQWLNREATRILSEQPDSVGISVMYPQQIFFSLALARYLKEEVRAESGQGQSLKIFLGGATLSAIESVELLAASSYIDALVVGEGEEGFKQLLAGAPYESIPGLLYRKSDLSSPDIRNIQHNPDGCPSDLHTLPAPDFSLLTLRRYFNPQPVLPILFSRGCRWRVCRFCAHNFSFARYRHKTVTELVTELQNYHDTLGVEHFYFADQYLGADSLEALATELLKRKLAINFHFMGRPAGGYNTALLTKLFQAGCRWISWGVESGSQRLLDIVNKGTTRAEILRILKETKDCGINNLAMMIFGLPTSTEDDLKETCDFLELAAPAVSAMTESEFVLYKHTPFANEPAKYGLEISGEEILCRIKGFLIHSHRLTCESQADPVNELAWWRRRKPWIFSPRLYDRLNAEHYLLYATYHSHTAKI